MTKSFNKPLKSIRVKNYLDNDNHGEWKLSFDYELQDFSGDVIFKGNLQKIYWQSFYIHVYGMPLQQKL